MRTHFRASFKKCVITTLHISRQNCVCLYNMGTMFTLTFGICLNLLDKIWYFYPKWFVDTLHSCFLALPFLEGSPCSWGLQKILFEEKTLLANFVSQILISVSLNSQDHFPPRQGGGLQFTQARLQHIFVSLIYVFKAKIST